MQVTVTAVFLVCHSIRAIVSLAELLVTLLGENMSEQEKAQCSI